MKRNIILLMGIILLAVLAGVGWSYRELFWNPPPGAITLHGNVDDRQLKLSFLISERIEALNVEEGALVRRGDLLGSLERVRIQNHLNVAVAGLERCKAALEKTVNGSREEDIAIARAEADSLRAKLKAAESDYKRQANLIDVSASSRKEAEAAEANCMMFRHLLLAAENNVRKLENGSRKEDIAVARAELARAEAEVAVYQQQWKDCQLFAPCDGVIRNRILEPGEMASPSQPVYILAVVSPKWIRTYLPETYLTQVRNGDRAIVRFDGAPGREFEGWVGFISPNAEFTPKNVETPEIRTSLVYEMRVFVKDPENLLKLGGPATVIFPECFQP